MIFVLNAAIVVATFLFMEIVAWSTHKYVMHGFLWNIHRDHHQGSQGFFESNDLFFLVFAIPGWLFTMFGVIHGLDWKLYVGIGMILYGIAYFLVHDVIIHERFKWLRNWNPFYVKAIKRAHKMHHKHLDRHKGESFGMLWAGKKYRDMVRNKKSLLDS